MQTAIDDRITHRILRILTTPWPKQQAYTLGIIDAHGNPLRKYNQLPTKHERNCYTTLTRLCFRLKRIIEKSPANKQYVSYAAALALLRECAGLDDEPVDLESMFFEVREMDGLDTELVEAFLNDDLPLKSFMVFREDAGAVAGGAVAANATGPAVAGTGDDNTTVVVKKKPKIQTRSKPQV